MLDSLLKALKARLTAVVWVLLGLFALVAVGGVMNHAADEHLRTEAEQAALNWADHVARNVPDLDLIFEGDAPGVLAQDQLTVLRTLGEVFRFEFFNAQGERMLTSDSLASAQASSLDADVSRRHAIAVARRGSSEVTLIEGDGAARPRLYSEAYVPVRLSGSIVGAVKVFIDQTGRQGRIGAAFRGVAIVVAMTLGSFFGVGIGIWTLRLRRERHAKEKMTYLARHDALTGALNRASFIDAVAAAGHRCAEGGPGFAVLCIDLAGFKDINDAHGHTVGDEVLRQAVSRLAQVVRTADVVARLGGDEFALLQVGVASSDDVATLAQRSVETLAAPYDIAGQRLVGGACVGVAIHGTDATEAAALLHRADLALHGVRARSRTGFGFFDPQLDQQLQTRRELTRELALALDGRGLTLHFQPLYGADGSTLRGYEALLRWVHPLRGLIAPGEFIPLAESSGLIVPLGRWVLQRACSEAATWPGHLSVAVNLSAAQFGHDDSLVQDVLQTLAGSGLSPRRLELEITESMLMADTAQVLSCLHALHAMGVRIAMDDFGTGYSSLAYLWRFPFDKVKIDRAFTQNLHGDEKVSLIVRSIISLAHSLGIRVNAEGVETEIQARLLRDLGCDELQGFLLGRPAPAERIAHRTAVPLLAAPAARRGDAQARDHWSLTES